MYWGQAHLPIAVFQSLGVMNNASRVQESVFLTVADALTIKDILSWSIPVRLTLPGAEFYVLLTNSLPDTAIKFQKQL
jgi:hypothetical protein